MSIEDWSIKLFNENIRVISVLFNSCTCIRKYQHQGLSDVLITDLFNVFGFLRAMHTAYAATYMMTPQHNATDQRCDAHHVLRHKKNCTMDV